MTTVEIPIWLLHVLVFLAMPGIAYLAEGIPLLFEELLRLHRNRKK